MKQCVMALNARRLMNNISGGELRRSWRLGWAGFSLAAALRQTSLNGIPLVFREQQETLPLHKQQMTEIRGGGLFPPARSRTSSSTKSASCFV